MKEMSFTDHLTELRSTVMRVLIIVIISFGVCYHYGDIIAEFLLAPLRTALEQTGNNGEIVFLEILDKVLAQFQVAFWSALITSSPLWFWELWKFIKPGLYEREVKVVRPFILVGFLLFWCGVAFGYFIVFPNVFQILLNFGVQNATATMSLKGYLVLCCKVLVFLGVIFQLPNIILILGYMGLVTKQSLSSMRSYVYVGFAVGSALLTPPDIVTMLGLWFPLVCLFEVGRLGVAIFVHPWLAKRHGPEGTDVVNQDEVIENE